MAEQRDSDPAEREGALLRALADAQAELRAERERAARTTADFTLDVLEQALGRERKALEEMGAERDRWRTMYFDTHARLEASLSRRESVGLRLGELHLQDERLEVESADLKRQRMVTILVAALGLAGTVLASVVARSWG